ncbi:MAG: alkyl hydroperoxide reductase [Acidobacteria bacterium]|nr:MAG: alkyl hydroperoxide reductase [Acidobacteriota bacterium]
MNSASEGHHGGRGGSILRKILTLSNPGRSEDAKSIVHPTLTSVSSVVVPGSNRLRLRWAIAAASALALALLTLATPLPLWLDHIDAAGSRGACPANAKAANLDFTLKDINNQDVRLASLKGKVILLDFWATWCGPCKIEIPWFIEMQNKYGSSGLRVVGISVDDTLDKLKPFVSQMKMNYTVLQGLDHDDVQDAFGPIFGVPVTLVISREGKICTRHMGLGSKPDFENAIKALL